MEDVDYKRLLIQLLEIEPGDIQQRNGETYIEAADAFERKFWDMSKDELIQFISSTSNDKM